MEVNKEFYIELEEFINELKDKKNDVKILNFVLEKLDTIPVEVQKFIAEKTGLLEISIENTINFYPKFRNKVSGKKIKEVSICVGMTCGVYGKGFYDRFLAAHPGFTTVAAAFEFQLFDAVPFEETDVLPQMLVTEQKIYR